VPNCQQRERRRSVGSCRAFRPWLQTGFLGVWLAPLGRWLHGIPGCGSTATPAVVRVRLSGGRGGKLRRAAAGGRGSPVFIDGLLLLVGAVSGSLVCGWACPFGFLQDLLGKIFPRKFLCRAGWATRDTSCWWDWSCYANDSRFKGIPFEKQAISICRLCPAGALEAGVPYSVSKPDGRQRLG